MPRAIAADFGANDSILFLALWWRGGRVCALTDIIGTCDWMNRAIPSAEELDGGWR